VECQSSPPRSESHCRSSLGAGGLVAWRSCRAQGPVPAHSRAPGSAALWRTRADACLWATPDRPSTGAALPALGRLQAGTAEGCSRGIAGYMGRKSTVAPPWRTLPLQPEPLCGCQSLLALRAQALHAPNSAVLRQQGSYASRASLTTSENGC